MKIRTLFVFSLLVLFGFSLNYIWENLHLPLYANYENFKNSLSIPILVYASIIDAFFVILIYLLLALRRKKLLWIDSIRASDAAVSIILGILIAISIELRALNSGKWSYNDNMPTLPGMEVGISPILQMIFLPIIIFTLIKIIVWKPIK